ncbi:Wolframin, partial [Stegodyphus mimosarum]
MSISSLSFLNFDVTYELGKNFQLHISFISCLALPFVLPYLYTKMALGSERKGWHLVLLPHLMSVTWMNLACVHLADSSNDLILSLFTWLIVLVVSYYLGTFLTFVLYSFIKAVWVSNLISLEFIPLILTFAILYAISLLIVKKLKISNDNKLWSLVICLIILLLSYRAAKPQALNLESDSSSVLSWDKYQTYCHHHAWYRTNPAEVQISCLPLKGRKVSVEGTITGIDVIEVQNSVQVIANILPNPLHKWFVCLLGKKYIHCDAEVMTQVEKEQCKLHETFNFSDCHLHNWNEYKYQIILEVSTRTSPEIILYGDHVCSSFIRGLKEGDSLQAIGTLESNIGGTLPKFHLKEAYCGSCYSDAECKTSFVVPVPNYDLSLKNVVGFYLSPFIQFEPKLNS